MNKQIQRAIAKALEQNYFRGIEEGNLNLLQTGLPSRHPAFGDVKGQSLF